MTKAKSKSCMCCTHWDGGCSKGWRPRFYKVGGLRRVCDDFAVSGTKRVPTTFERWIGSLKAIFGGEV